MGNTVEAFGTLSGVWVFRGEMFFLGDMIEQ
jgi:hypothetical protein